jgi:VanZ family protein
VSSPRLRLPAAAFHPASWFSAFAAWFCILWILSERSRPFDRVPLIPQFDKVLHFGWFFGGAGLLAAFLFRLRPSVPPSLLRGILAVLLLAGVGALDEWHQSWVLGRDGNSIPDWIADVAGSIAGFLVFQRFGRPLLTRRSPS